MDPHAHPGPVARDFAARRQAWEEERLSPLGRALVPGAPARCRSRTAALRTPLQRDRDRIVHCKAFRRLKHKTQVFVAPEGDHYRTRLTHTLEVTQIARTVARALRAQRGPHRGDRPRATTSATRRSATSARTMLDALPARALRRAASATSSTRCASSTCSSATGAGLNLCDDVRDGILCHSGRAPLPRTLEGRIVRHRRPRRLHQPRHRRRAARRRAARRASCPPSRSPCWATRGSQRIDALVHDLVEHSERGGRHRPGRRRRRGDGRAARRSCSSSVYLGAAARREHAKIERVAAHAVRPLRRRPRALPDGGGAPGADLAQRVTDYLAGMTDRYCMRAFEALAVPESFARRRLRRRWRGTRDDSKERVRDAVDMVDLVGVAHRAAPRGRATATGPVPVPRGAHAVVRRSTRSRSSTTASAARRGRRRVHVRAGDRGRRLQGRARAARRPLRRAARARGGGPARGRARQAPRAAARAARAHGGVLRALPVGVRARRRTRASTSPGAGCEEATLREFRVGYAPSAWDTVLHGVAARRASATASSYDAGLAQRAQGRGADLRPLPPADHVPAVRPARARARLRRARAGRADQQPKYLNRPEGDVFHKGRHAVRRRPRAGARGARPGASSLAEGYTDVIAMHQAGLRNAVGIMGTALTEEQVGELARLAPVVLLALDADSAGQEAMLRAARVARGPQAGAARRPAAAGQRPGGPRLRERGRRGAMRELVEASVPFVRFRVERELDARGPGERRGQGPRSSRRCGRCSRRSPPSALREELLAARRRPRGHRAGARGVVAGRGPGLAGPRRAAAPRGRRHAGERAAAR